MAPVPEKIGIARLYKVFGRDPAAALQMRHEGRSRAEIRHANGGMIAVEDVNLSVRAGEVFIVMGLSGSGKSTLVRCINRLIEPTAGTVSIDGEEVTRFAPARLRDLRRHRVSMVFQNFALLPHRTVLQNVESGLAIRGEPKRSRRDKAVASLELVGLREWALHYPETLSGGMRQRVGLARALAAETDILLMDEPFSALDPLIRRDLQGELLKLQARLQKTIVFVTHDFHEAIRIGSRIAIMRHGQIVQTGTPQEIVTRPADDYIADFTRDIDRAQLFRVRDLMQRPPKLPDGDIGSIDISAEISVILAAGRRPAGYVLKRSNAGAVGGRDHLPGPTRVRELPSIRDDRAIADLYPLMVDGGPVAAIDGGGGFVGLVTTADLLAHLGGTSISAPTETSPSAPS